MRTASQAHVTIRLDRNGRVYRPGELLSGQYRLEGVARREIKAVEVSVLWYTDGKGESDFSVHFFQRLSAERGDWIDSRGPGHFGTVLPAGPLSYEGAIVKVRWCVRVRAFLHQGKEIVGELPFRLGETLPAQDAAP